jgi:hypothetical protein
MRSSKEVHRGTQGTRGHEELLSCVIPLSGIGQRRCNHNCGVPAESSDRAAPGTLRFTQTSFLNPVLPAFPVDVLSVRKH